MVFLLLILQWQLRHHNSGKGGLQAAKAASSLSTKDSLSLTIPCGMQKIQVPLSFIFLILASREIHHRSTHSWAGIKTFKKGGSQVLVYCWWEEKGNIIPPSDDLGTASFRKPSVLQDSW